MPEVDKEQQAAEVAAAVRVAIEARNPIDLDVVTQAFLATHSDLEVDDVLTAVEVFVEDKPQIFKAASAEGPSQEVVDAARAAIEAANPIDLDVVTQAFLATLGNADVGSVPEAAKAFVSQKSALFVQSKRASKESDRYIVETTVVFELLGSTVTFREGQILQVDSREYEIARDHDVALRPLAQIKR